MAVADSPAFPYRIPPVTEKIIAEYMEKEGIKVKTKCLNYLINSRPILDQELQQHKREISRLNKQLKILQTLLVKKDVSKELLVIIKSLERSKIDIERWRKKFKGW